MTCDTFYGRDCDGTLFVNIKLVVRNKEHLIGLLEDLIKSKHYGNDITIGKLIYQLKAEE